MRQNSIVGITVAASLLSLYLSGSAPERNVPLATLELIDPAGEVHYPTLPLNESNTVMLVDRALRPVHCSFDVPYDWIPVDDMPCLEGAPVIGFAIDEQAGLIILYYDLAYPDGTPVKRTFRLAGEGDWT